MLPSTTSSVSKGQKVGLAALPYSPPMFEEVEAETFRSLTLDEVSFRTWMLNISIDDPECLRPWVFFLVRCQVLLSKS